jgi:hypothetical protein
VVNYFKSIEKENLDLHRVLVGEWLLLQINEPFAVIDTDKGVAERLTGKIGGPDQYIMDYCKIYITISYGWLHHFF